MPLDELRKLFGRKSAIFALLVDDLFAKRTIDYTADGMMEAEKYSKQLLDELMPNIWSC